MYMTFLMLWIRTLNRPSEKDIIDEILYIYVCTYNFYNAWAKNRPSKIYNYDNRYYIVYNFFIAWAK